MNDENKIPLDAIAGESPLCVCSQCGRKTWAREHLLGAAWKRCLMPLPKGGQCRGVWIPEDAAPMRPTVIGAKLMRDILCSVGGVDRIEDIAITDLLRPHLDGLLNHGVGLTEDAGQIQIMRELLCTVAGVDGFEDIDVNDLMSYSRLREEWDTATVTNHKLREQIQRLLNQQAELIRPRLEQLKPDTELSDGHFVGCPPGCHCTEAESLRGHRLDCPSNATRRHDEN